MKIASNRNHKIIFWISTCLFGAFMLTSAIPNIFKTKEWVDIFHTLGYPLYMLPFIGLTKLLGVVALLIPGFPRLKEWAYAGFFFDLTGAVYSGISTGGFHSQMLIMLVPFVLGTLSYIYHHKIIQESIASNAPNNHRRITITTL